MRNFAPGSLVSQQESLLRPPSLKMHLTMHSSDPERQKYVDPQLANKSHEVGEMSKLLYRSNDYEHEKVK